MLDLFWGGVVGVVRRIRVANGGDNQVEIVRSARPFLVRDQRAGSGEFGVAVRRASRVPGDHQDVALIGFKERLDGFCAHLTEAQHGGVHFSALSEQIVQSRRGEAQHGFGRLCEAELLSN